MILLTQAEKKNKSIRLPRRVSNQNGNHNQRHHRHHQYQRSSKEVTKSNSIWSSLSSLSLSSRYGTTPASTPQKAIVHGVDTTQCPTLSLLPSKSKYEIAIIACGCFWNPQFRLQKKHGIKRVIVGYTGGQHMAPTFNRMQDHTRAIFIEYNPKKITYQQILQYWQENDDPWESEESWDNRSALFVTNSKQYQQAQDFVTQLAQTRPYCGLYVDIEEVKIFYQAEQYQQDYLTKQLYACKKQLTLYAAQRSPTILYPIAE